MFLASHFLDFWSRLHVVQIYCIAGYNTQSNVWQILFCFVLPVFGRVRGYSLVPLHWIATVITPLHWAKLELLTLLKQSAIVTIPFKRHWRVTKSKAKRQETKHQEIDGIFDVLLNWSRHNVTIAIPLHWGATFKFAWGTKAKERLDGS